MWVLVPADTIFFFLKSTSLKISEPVQYGATFRVTIGLMARYSCLASAAREEQLLLGCSKHMGACTQFTQSSAQFSHLLDIPLGDTTLRKYEWANNGLSALISLICSLILPNLLLPEKTEGTICL